MWTPPCSATGRYGRRECCGARGKVGDHRAVGTQKGKTEARGPLGAQGEGTRRKRGTEGREHSEGQRSQAGAQGGRRSRRRARVNEHVDRGPQPAWLYCQGRVAHYMCVKSVKTPCPPTCHFGPWGQG